MFYYHDDAPTAINHPIPDFILHNLHELKGRYATIVDQIPDAPAVQDDDCVVPFFLSDVFKAHVSKSVSRDEGLEGIVGGFLELLDRTYEEGITCDE